MNDIRKIVMNLCGHKIVWNDCVITGARMIRALKGLCLTEHEKSVIEKWAESDSRRVVFVENQ